MNSTMVSDLLGLLLNDVTSEVSKKQRKKEFDKMCDNILPLLRYKMSGDFVKFKGKKVPVEDIFNFVKSGDSYYPRFYVNEVKPEDKVIDMTPFLCTGVAELAYFTASDKHIGIASKFLDSVKNVFLTIDELNTISDELIITGNEDTDNPLAYIIYNMSSPYIDYRFEGIKKLASRLLILSFTRKADLCDCILNGFTYIFDFVSLFYFDKEQLEGMSQTNEDVKFHDSNDMLNDFMTSKLLRFKRIGYTAPDSDKKHYISDCRGLSIYSVLILMMCVYDKFGEFASSQPPVLNPHDEHFNIENQKHFSACIGDDAIGHYIRNGHVRTKSFDVSKFGGYVINSGIFPIRGSLSYKTDNREVLREVFEKEIVLRYAYNVNYNGFKDKNYERSINSICYFESVEQLWGSSLFFMPEDLNDAYIDTPYIKELLDKLDSLQKVSDKYDSMKEDYEHKLTNELTTVEEKHSKEIESYEEKIKNLEYQLSLKSDFITKLSGELEDANTKLERMFTDEDLSAEVISSEDISIEDMVDFLNDFKFAMVGGRDELLSNLAEIGWTNVFQISKESSTNVSTQADFFCINTRFISHKVVRMIESVHQDEKEQMFYYNGTNTQLLVQVCYDFVTAWFGKESN